MNSYPKYFYGRENEYEVVIANNMDQRSQAWKLVCDNYKEKGYADSGEEFWYGQFDVHPDTITFLTFKNDEPIATMTMVFDTELGLPADNLFSNEINKMRKNGKHCFEIISLACNCIGMKESAEVLMHMFMLANIAAQHKYNATDWIITVNPRHVEYYKKIMFFETVGKPKRYGKVNGAVAVLLTMDNTNCRERFKQKYGVKDFSTFLDDKIVEHRIYRFIRRNTMGLKWEDAKEWFENRKKLLSQMPREALRQIMARYFISEAELYTFNFKFKS